MLFARLLLGCAIATAASALLSALDESEARHLLSRTGFGPTPDEIAALLRLTREDAVDSLLAGIRYEPCTPIPAWCETSLAENASQRADEEKSWKDLDEEARQKKVNERNDRDHRRGIELKAWWYREMAATDSPLTERMVLLWHNHFTSGLTTVGDPRLMFEQNQLFRVNALAKFDKLLTAMPTDPAMFIYLDSNSNINDRPNENFAREVMELFTVGEGFYSEGDIKEAARALTGYKIDESGRPALTERWHDTGWKTVLGHKGVFDADSVMKILMEREERVAIHICEKLWQEFIAEDISSKETAKEIYAIAAVFFHAKYDIRKAVRATLLTSRFWDESNRGTLVRSPAELLVGTIRQLDLPADDGGKLVDMGRALGQDLLDPPNVKGWKGGSAWISTQSLLARREALSAIAGGALGHPNGKHKRVDAAGGGMMKPDDGMKPGLKPGDAKKPAAEPEKPAGPHPDRGRWIPEARKDGAAGVARASALLLPVAPVRALAADANFDQAFAQLLLDPAYNLK